MTREADRAPASPPAGQLTVAVMWRMLGSYHVARLAAAENLLRQKAARLVAVETARTDSTYPWDVIDSPGRFRRETLFPRCGCQDLRAGQISRAVAEALTRIDPDVVAVCGWASPESRSAIAWCRARRRAAVVMSESKYDDAPRRGLHEAVKRRFLGLCDAALVGGAPHRDYVVRLGMADERVFEGYDAVDNDLFAAAAAVARDGPHPDRRGLAIPPGAYFLASNRFIPRKNLAGLLRAYAGYRAAIGTEAWDLVLLGDGQGRADIEALAAGQDIPGVWFPGFRQVDELPVFYGLAECFVHPALQDQWGLVVNEAMACGLPVLVSRAAGCRYDLVREGHNGWTFDPTSVDQIAEAMVRVHRLGEDGRRAMGAESARIIAGWGPERFAESLWQAVQAAVAHARRRAGGLGLADRAFLAALAAGMALQGKGISQ